MRFVVAAVTLVLWVSVVPVPKQDLALELYYSGSWHDVATDDKVFADAPVTIRRGLGDESGGWPRPATITARLDNASDKYRTSNPESPLYGLAGRNTPMRASVGGTVRGIVEASSWSADQTPDFRASPRRGKAWVDVNGGGVLQRIGQWNQPLRSALYRYVDKSGVTPAEWWPMEDASGSATAASAAGGSPLTPVTAVRYTLPDGNPLPPGGAPKFADGAGITGSDKLPSFQGGGTLSAPVRSASFNGYAIDWVMQFAAGTDDGGTSSADVLRWRESGTYVMFTVNVVKNNITVVHSNAADAVTLTGTGSASATFDVYDGAPHHFRYQVRQSGGNYLAQLLIDSSVVATADNFTPGMTGTVGRPTQIEWNPGEQRGDYMPTAAGHLIVWASGQLGGQPAVFYALNGYAGERTAYRFSRLLTEEGIACYVSASFDDSMPMGPQRPDSLPNLVKECLTTEDGLVYDHGTDLRPLFLCRADRYNQTPKLDLAPTDLTVLPKEVNDDKLAGNVVTASQRDGGDSTARDDTGPLGTQPPPDGAGEEKRTVNVNLNDPDDDLPQVANWWLKRGTVDLPRFPQLTIDLNANPGLVADVEAIKPGDVITLTGFRENVIRLIVLGWTETIGTHTRTIVFTCVPDQQFQVGVWDSTSSRWDSSSTMLVGSLTTSGTAVKIGTTSPNESWSTAGVPYDVMVSGERMTVTAMGATTTDATLSANGFESGVGGWQSSNGTLTQSSTFANSGSFSGLLTVTGSPVEANIRKAFASCPRVVPGQEYTLSTFVRSVATITAACHIDWLDENGVFLSRNGTSGSLSSGAWASRVVTATAPAGAAYAQYGATISGSPVAGTLLYADDLVLTATTIRYQTATLTRSVNGIVKAQTPGTPVHVATPGRWAL